MCLDTVTKTGNIKDGFGWKAMDTNLNGSLVNYLMGTRKSMPRKTWVNELCYRNTTMTELRTTFRPLAYYPVGFHVFNLKRDAKDWGFLSDEIVKVQYRKAHTVGLQEDMKIIVAKEIKILK